MGRTGKIVDHMHDCLMNKRCIQHKMNPGIFGLESAKDDDGLDDEDRKSCGAL